LILSKFQKAYWNNNLLKAWMSYNTLSHSIASITQSIAIIWQGPSFVDVNQLKSLMMKSSALLMHNYKIDNCFTLVQ
jgi:hypothetical protein